jgi:hypothetical protein
VEDGSIEVMTEGRVQEDSNGNRWLFIPGREHEEPVLLDPGLYCGVEGEQDGRPNAICLEANGPHEHRWTPFSHPARANAGGPIADAVDPLLREFDASRGRPKLREGDQPLPTGDESLPDIQSMVIADIEARRQVGIQRYNQALRPFNGRNTMQDFYEELVDATIYARSVLEMQAASRDRLIEVVATELRKNAVAGNLPPTAEPIMFTTIATLTVDAIIDTLTE